MERLRRLRDYWALGVVVLLILAGMAAATGAVVLLLLTIVSAIFGQNDPAFGDWFWISAVIWLPVAIGMAVPTMTRILRPRFEEMSETERQAELKPYLKS